MRISLLVCFLAFAFGVNAQEPSNIQIKKGSKLTYNISTSDRDIPFLIIVDSISPAFVRLKWQVEGHGDGSWSMKSKSLETGNRGAWEDPQVGTDTELPEEQTVLLLSNTGYNSLLTKGKTEYDQQSYTVKQPTEQQQIKLNGKVVETFYMESDNGNSRIWVLKNSSFPAILKIEGNPVGPNLFIQQIN